MATVVAACNGPSSRGADPGAGPTATKTPDPAKAPMPPTPPSSDAPSSRPSLTTFADVAAHVGGQVEAHGTYAVVSTGRHKIMYTRADGSTGASNKVVRLELDGGALDLWVRPDDEQAALTGKRVVAIGKLIGPTAAQPGVAAPDARPSLVEITSITAE